MPGPNTCSNPASEDCRPGPRSLRRSRVQERLDRLAHEFRSTLNRAHSALFGAGCPRRCDPPVTHGRLMHAVGRAAGFLWPRGSCKSNEALYVWPPPSMVFRFAAFVRRRHRSPLQQAHCRCPRALPPDQRPHSPTGGLLRHTAAGRLTAPAADIRGCLGHFDCHAADAVLAAGDWNPMDEAVPRATKSASKSCPQKSKALTRSATFSSVLSSVTPKPITPSRAGGLMGNRQRRLQRILGQELGFHEDASFSCN